MSEAVDVAGLSKVYDNGTKALAGLELRSERGALLTLVFVARSK